MHQRASDSMSAPLTNTSLKTRGAFSMLNARLVADAKFALLVFFFAMHRTTSENFFFFFFFFLKKKKKKHPRC